MLWRCEFCTTKKRPGVPDINAVQIRDSWWDELTANDDPKQNTDDKVPGSHRNHDARNSEVFWFAHTVACVPKCLFDKIDSEHEDECTHNHDRCYPRSCKLPLTYSMRLNSRIYEIGPVPASNTATVAPASIRPASRVVPPTR